VAKRRSRDARAIPVRAAPTAADDGAGVERSSKLRWRRGPPRPAACDAQRLGLGERRRARPSERFTVPPAAAGRLAP